MGDGPDRFAILSFDYRAEEQSRPFLPFSAVICSLMILNCELKMHIYNKYLIYIIYIALLYKISLIV